MDLCLSQLIRILSVLRTIEKTIFSQSFSLEFSTAVESESKKSVNSNNSRSDIL